MARHFVRGTLTREAAALRARRSAFSEEEVGEERQDEAEDDAGGDRDVNAHAFAFEHEVAGEPAEAELAADDERESEEDDEHAEHYQAATELVHARSIACAQRGMIWMGAGSFFTGSGLPTSGLRSA